MNNIPIEKLNKVSSTTGELIEVINEGVRWSDAYLKDNDKARTNYEIKKYRRYLKNIKGVITKKTVLSLFGKSQVGKSYLVDSILSTSLEPKLSIPDYFHGTEHAFIGELNPPGGKESTGVVSRFSIEKNERSDSATPIEVKLLSAKDIILILCDTYYSDIKYYSKPVTDAEINAFLESLPDYSSSQAQLFLSEDDVFDIKDYLEKYFKDKSVINEFEDNGFWDKVAANIIKVAPENWYKIFELLWGRNTRFSEMFVMLVEELKTLGFSETVYAEFNALLVQHGSILDVQRIFELNNDPYNEVRVETAGRQAKTIKRSRLAALTYEVAIPLKAQLAEEKEFLRNVDILDFPGARAREVYDENDIKALENKEFFNFYRRGKVSYLFNRYTENYEISSLLFCIDHEQLEVKNLPNLLNNWIEYYIGSDIEQRTQTLIPYSQGKQHLINPLFIIFTKANIMLQHKDIDNSGKYDYKWETRFKSIFVNEFCKGYDWHDNWVKQQGNIEKFKNLFMLRSFDHPESIYEGYLENEKETGINPQRKAYMDGLKQSFANYEFNKAHFYDPKRSWEEFTSLNKDGSQYIIENLTPVATNEIRSLRYINLLNMFKQKAMQQIEHHFHSDESDEQIRRASKEGSDLQLKMDIVFGADAFHFGNFIEHLTVSENEILKFFHELLRSEKLIRKQETNKYILLRIQNPQLSVDKSYEENLEVLRRNYNKDTSQETEYYFVEVEKIDLQELFFGDLYNLQNNSLILADEARDYWFNTKLTLENFAEFIALGFDPNMLEKLFDNLKITFNRLKINKEIAKEIRNYVDVSKRIDRAEDMVADITAGKINEFVNSVGWTYFSEAERQKIRETNLANNLNLRVPQDEEVFQSMERISENAGARMSVEALIDLMYELNDKLNERPIDRETLQYVPMIRNYQRWSELMKISFIANCDIPNYNVEANKILGDILNKMKQFNFQLT